MIHAILSAPSIPFISPKGSRTTVISELKAGVYEPSSLAVGEEKDLAQNTGENLGFVRSAQLEQYLNQVRSNIVAASGQSGVPGRVVLLASSELAAYSAPAGNIYVAMAWLGNFANTDESLPCWRTSSRMSCSGITARISSPRFSAKAGRCTRSASPPKRR